MRKFELTLREVVIDDNHNEIKQRIIRGCKYSPLAEDVHNTIEGTDEENKIYNGIFISIEKMFNDIKEFYTNPENRTELLNTGWSNIIKGE